MKQVVGRGEERCEVGPWGSCQSWTRGEWGRGERRDERTKPSGRLVQSPIFTSSILDYPLASVEAGICFATPGNASCPLISQLGLSPASNCLNMIDQPLRSSQTFVPR